MLTRTVEAGWPESRQSATAADLVSTTRVFFVLGCAAFVAAFAVVYEHVISPVYSYWGMTCHPIQSPAWLIFYLFAWLPCLWLPLDLSRPTQYLYFFLYITVILPVCCVLPVVAPSYPLPFGVALWIGGSLLVCFAVLGSIYKFPLAIINTPRMNPGIFALGVTATLVACYSVLFLTFGSVMDLVSLTSPHEHRLSSRTIITSSTLPLLGYCLVLPSRAFHPFLIATAWWFRKWWLLAVAIVGELICFSCAAQREGVFWILVFVPFLLALFKLRKPFFVVMIWAFVVAFLAVAVTSDVNDDSGFSFISRVTTMRIFVGPGKLTIDYLIYFQDAPMTFFSHITGFGWVHENHYSDTSIAVVMGEYLTGNADNNANCNLWADGYASLGFAGMLIVTLITAALFYITDSVLRDIDPRPLTLAFSRLGLALSNCNIFTVFLGGGFLVAILLGMLAPWNPVAHSAEDGCRQAWRKRTKATGNVPSRSQISNN